MAATLHNTSCSECKRLYRKTPLVCNYYCRQKTIFYHSSALIQVEAQISEEGNFNLFFASVKEKEKIITFCQEEYKQDIASYLIKFCRGN